MQWAKDSPGAIAVRSVGKNRPDSTTDYQDWLANDNPAVVANAIICLIHQANYLLDRQVQALERQFVQQGGYSEQLAAARLRERKQRIRTDRSDPTDLSEEPSSPKCPVCNGIMVVRTARKGPYAGKQFWGCTKYPDCKGSRPL